MTLRVELIYDRDCPNVEAARAVLLRAFVETGVPASWAEWDRQAPESPERVRGYGSPTILVNGHDVAGAAPGSGADCCRVYDHGAGQLQGVPPVERIAKALAGGRDATQSEGGKGKTGWRGMLASISGAAPVLLPVGVCPACWPAYAGVLSSIGLGFLFNTVYLLPISAACLLLALGALAYRARSRRGYGPLGLGAAGAALALAGKFAFESDQTLYAGVALLVLAAIWNIWPRRAAGECPACATPVSKEG